MFQPVKFRDVDDMLSSLPRDEFEITEVLRELIFSALPNVQERLSYNVPFYFGKKRICFIWPGSVPWGGIKEGVAIGFMKGNRLEFNNGYLMQGKRKEVFMRTFYSLKEIDADVLKTLLFEADLLDRCLKNT